MKRISVRGIIKTKKGLATIFRRKNGTEYYVIPGGGVDNNENLEDALKRELKEELGVEVDVICKIGEVSDYYNLIHRHNINNYFLCKVKSFGDKKLTKEEMDDFHLSTLRLSYEEACKEYEYRSNSKLGKLISNRELPILHRAKEILDKM